MSSTESSSSASDRPPSQRRTLADLERTRRIIENCQSGIQKRSAELVEAINTDAPVDEILAFYDSDVEFLAKSTPPCRGNDALRIFYVAMQRASLHFAERRAFELHSLSPFLAIERGTYVLRGRGREIAGNYFVLWIKRDDWVIIEECRL